MFILVVIKFNGVLIASKQTKEVIINRSKTIVAKSREAK